MAVIENALRTLAEIRGYWADAEVPFAAEEIEMIDAITEDPPGLTDEQWAELFDRLAGPDACNFQDDKWTCAGGNDKTFATEILMDMGIDEQERGRVLSLVDVLGGHCDCEILFNAEPRIR